MQIALWGNDKMIKKEFIRAVAERSQMTAAAVGRVLEEASGVAAEALAANGKVRYPDLVTLRARHYEARDARNPKTGEPCVIPAGRRVRVKPVTAFVDRYERSVSKTNSISTLDIHNDAGVTNI